MSTLLQAALDYAARGFAVFPLRPKSKLPATPNGFKDATTDEAQIRTWWGVNAEYNIGIATGEVSGLVVLDVDYKHGGLKTLETLPVMPTLTAATGGGGYHYYFKYPTGMTVRNKAGFLPGLDLRASGGFVVAPPSVHESDKPYRWFMNAADTPVLDLPPWLAELVVDRPRDPGIAQPRAEALPEGARGDLAKSTLKFILFGAEPGTWHHTLVKASLDLKQQGYELLEAIGKLESGGIELDSHHDIPTVEDVFFNREVRHPPRLPETAAPGAEVAQTSSIVVRAGDLGQSLVDYLSDKDVVRGEPTGITSLDKLLGGGKRLGEVTAWHAEAKTGKNTIWHKLMHLWLKRNIAMGYASRELTPETEVLPDILSIEYQENVRLAAMEGTRPARYQEFLKASPLFFASGYGHFAPDDIRRWMDELQRLGVQYFWFDHLHYMLEDPEEHKLASRLIKDIKTMAKERNVHVDIIIQPNKLMDGQKLSLNSIKGGAAMGQAIDNLIIIEHTGTKHVRKVELKAARSKLADPGSFFLQFDPLTMDFIEVIPEEAPPMEPPSPGNPSWGRDRMIFQS